GGGGRCRGRVEGNGGGGRRIVLEHPALALLECARHQASTLVEGAVELELMFRPILRFGCRHLISAVARRHVVHDCGRFTGRGGWSAAFNLIKQVVEIALHLGEEVVAFLQLVDQRDYFLSWTPVMIVLPELENEFHLLIFVEL